MIVKLSKITETLIEDKPGFASEFNLDSNNPENKEFLALVIVYATKERPKELRIGKRYVVDITPFVSAKKET